MTIYKRIIIKGILTTKSNFHIGTGKEEIETDQRQFNQICLDNNGKPYIPASSLRGYLRNIHSQHTQNTNEIFGLARQKTEISEATNKETGNIGLLRVYDCLWKSDSYTSQLVSQTSIDPVTATAKHHHLSSHAIIPPESRFKVHIELDNAQEQHLIDILKALQTLGKEHRGKLGKGKSTGQGECHWTLDEKGIQVLSKKKLKEWLTQEDSKISKHGKVNYKKLKKLKKQPETLKNHYSDYKTGIIEAYTSNLTTIEIRLKVNSPILINDPQTLTKRAKENQQSIIPDLIFKQQSNQAIIPGSTLKGWSRARARRILFTLFGMEKINQEVEKKVEDLTGQIFGSTQQQGYLYFDDARISFKQEDEHNQTFNAIDRFTGGVKEHALYSVEAIWPTDPFEGQIHLIKPLENWMKLLLLYIIRDSMEGDLVLGWGKGKGYGKLDLSLLNHQNWESLYSSLDSNILEQWDKDLQQKLQGESQ